MIAEIKNKISLTGSNLSDRYLPAEIGLRHVLSQARFDSQEAQDGWLAWMLCADMR